MMLAFNFSGINTETLRNANEGFAEEVRRRVRCIGQGTFVNFVALCMAGEVDQNTLTINYFHVGWVEGQNGGPLTQTFPVTSYLNKSSGRPAIPTCNPPTGRIILPIIVTAIL